MRISSFNPVVCGQTKILILGSMPSVKSLEENMYYGNPRNHFWELMARLLCVDMDTGYETRIQRLLEGGIGLWDVFESCQRKGSLDQDIKEEVPNNLVDLLGRYPNIECIVLNGSKAAKGFDKHFKLNIHTIRLPSTSPIPTKYCKSLDDKWEYWKVLRAEL
ncbi:MULTISPECIES: DNA-deoxyinosine glycosylase [unclassified Fusibacter]|uniref:DNA-deoxyinosine glycosylase n=1 Tax=unclassified Fusibacter TaxID=2624464 RepID=UPI0013E99CB3|nr:DNA-deoxyinosine glycosylase [Fusibacter sp. A1]MCK8059511.1 DNA-deoxyinosine glycosylase [Fusibacter sp. A2]NPE21025.1 DNA-deoxyinosine glycosylase [Fusibacter sp. A1]